MMQRSRFGSPRCSTISARAPRAPRCKTSISRWDWTKARGCNVSLLPLLADAFQRLADIAAGRRDRADNARRRFDLGACALLQPFRPERPPRTGVLGGVGQPVVRLGRMVVAGP